MWDWIKQNRVMSAVLALAIAAFIAVQVLVSQNDPWPPAEHSPEPTQTQSPTPDKPTKPTKPTKTTPPQRETEQPAPNEDTDPPTITTPNTPNPTHGPTTTPEPDPDNGPGPTPTPNDPLIGVDVPGVGSVELDLDKGCVRVGAGSLLGAQVNCPKG